MSKVPVLQELDPDFFIDQVYRPTSDSEEFQDAITQIRYNRVCKLFYAE